jgi:molybdopterin synthase catalytic subunit
MVSDGSLIRLQHAPIDVAEVTHAVASSGAGAIGIFVGTTRDVAEGRPVTELAYEAYDAMAVQELERIVATTREQWPVLKVAVVHRLGVVPVGEASVVIAVSTPHRADAFVATRYIIDTLKQTVPIWKKESFADGTAEWSNHPHAEMTGKGPRNA